MRSAVCLMRVLAASNAFSGTVPVSAISIRSLAEAWITASGLLISWAMPAAIIPNAERRAQAVASARLSALGMMAAGIAHEINNPLAVIHASASDLMEMAETGTVPLKALEAASTRIRQTADRISKIVKSLRQTAREGSTDPFQRASVGEIVEQALELCKERFRVHSVQLETPIVDPALHISCREVQIVQVLLNLLQNPFAAVVQRDDDRPIRLDVPCRHPPP